MKLKRLGLSVLTLATAACMAIGLSACGEEEHVHDLKQTAAREATCAAAGNSAYWSCDCGKYFSDANGETEIEKDSWVIAKTTTHTPKEEYKKDASGHWHECSVCGTALEKEDHDGDPCTVCEYTEEDQTGNQGGGQTDDHTHNMTTHAANAATCAAAGNTLYYSCDGENGCGKYFSDEKGETEITENSWVIDKLTTHGAPKTDDEGKTYWLSNKTSHWNECSICNEKLNTANHSAELPCEVCGYETPCDHIMTAHPAKAANCSASGNSLYYSCSECGKYFSDPEGEEEILAGSWNIAATGAHSPNTSYTKNASGHWKTCRICGTTVEALQTHRYENDSPYCSVCDYANFIPSEGLEFGPDTYKSVIYGRGEFTGSTIVIPQQTYNGSAWVTGINENAFEGDPDLEALVIKYYYNESAKAPGHLTIGKDAFANCPKFTKITFLGTKAEWDVFIRNPENFYSTHAITVVCDDGTFKIGVDLETEYTASEGLYISETVLKGLGTLEDEDNVLVIPNGVTEIESFGEITRGSKWSSFPKP